MPKHVRVELERINNKIQYFIKHLLVFLHTILQDALFNHQDCGLMFNGLNVLDNQALEDEVTTLSEEE
jgi:hypothetical protein